MHHFVFLLILIAAFAAGLIDSIIGGGGLISTPALFLAFPDMPVAQILATTKCASLAGTTGSAYIYARRVALPWRILVPAMLTALPSAWLGARAVSHLNPDFIRPMIMLVLVAMAVYTWKRPAMGARIDAPRHSRWSTPTAASLGIVLGFYDGFLGPGTGSMWVLLIISLYGTTFISASGGTKFINGMSNLGAILWFAPAGLIPWSLALPMAGFNLLGGLVGSRLAIFAGNAWIRRAFLTVVVALIAKLGWSLASSLVFGS